MKREQIERLIQVSDNRVTNVQEIGVCLLEFLGQSMYHPRNCVL